MKVGRQKIMVRGCGGNGKGVWVNVCVISLNALKGRRESSKKRRDPWVMENSMYLLSNYFISYFHLSEIIMTI